jgi:hypothetical protein
MRASRMYGSVRGALSNGRPYRDCYAARRNGRRAQRSATAWSRSSFPFTAEDVGGPGRMGFA